MRTLTKMIHSVLFDISWEVRGRCSGISSGLRPCGSQFSSPCNHNGILRSASKWLISLQASWRFSSQNKPACANVSSGDGDFCWDPAHHRHFTSRMFFFSSREGKIVASLAVDTQCTLHSCTILKDPMGYSGVCPVNTEQSGVEEIKKKKKSWSRWVNILHSAEFTQ